MYCVVQEVALKKTDIYGYPKRLESKYLQISYNGEDVGHYYYEYSLERFQRPIKKSYRISVHHSYRDNGNIKKIQIVLCTVNYYDFATDFFSVYEYCDRKIQAVSDALGKSVDEVYALVENKLEPIIEKIQEEFSKTEEFKTHQEHETIITAYTARKINFANEYNVDKNEYDRCYDVFGELKNPKYLEKIKRECEQRKQYEQEFRSYYEQHYNNYYKDSYSDYGSYYNSICNNYSDEDKNILKQFYRELSKKYHPDSNPDKDTSKQMKLLNELKKEWGL